MSLKRPLEDVRDRDPSSSTSARRVSSSVDGSSSNGRDVALRPSTIEAPNFTSKTAGKQKSSINHGSIDKWETLPGPSRTQPLLRSSQERFVPGLQTIVGGLQMSQNSSGASTLASASLTPISARLRRSLGPSEIIQPLVMSRNAEAERRASQSSAQLRSQTFTSLHVPEAVANTATDAHHVPGVSPGWHVEAHGRQAMELRDGIRHEDEDGWTPLDIFPAATPQGRLVAHRARMRARARLPALQPCLDGPANNPNSDPIDPSLQITSSSALSNVSAIVSSSATSEELQKSAGHSSDADDQMKVRTDSQKSTYSLQDFEVLETLGTGTFGRVLLVRLKGRNVLDRTAYFALKVLAKTDIVRLKQVSHVNSEREILDRVQHPFLVNMEATFQDSKNCYMLLEYVIGGEVFSYLRRAGSFSADVARFYISTIVLALEYLHDRDIIYRDLKPENLLIDNMGYTKITDFGFAKQVDERTWTLCGTPEYLAPEIIQCSGHGKAVDWWSLGILLFEMLAGYPPFYDPNPLMVYEKILQGVIIFPDQIDSVSRHLITSLLAPDRSQRLGNMHGGAQDVKNHAWFYGVDWKSLEQRQIRPPIIPYLGEAGDSSNFSKYDLVRQSQLPGLFELEPTYTNNLEDRFDNLFLDF